MTTRPPKPKTHRERLSDATPPSAAAAGLSCLDGRKKGPARQADRRRLMGGQRSAEYHGRAGVAPRESPGVTTPSLKVVHNTYDSHPTKERKKEPRNIASDFSLSLVVRNDFLFFFALSSWPYLPLSPNTPHPQIQNPHTQLPTTTYPITPNPPTLKSPQASHTSRPQTQAPGGSTSSAAAWAGRGLGRSSRPPP